MTPLRILHTADTYYPYVDGVAVATQRISEGLAARGHQVTVATGKHPRRNFQSLNGVRVVEFDISGNTVEGYIGDIKLYQKFVHQCQVDIMMNYAAQIWTSDLIFPLLNSLSCVKVFLPCGYSSLRDPKYKEYYQNMPWVLNHYDQIIYLSERYWDKQFGDEHGVTHYTIVGNGASFEEFSDRKVGFKQKYGIQTSRMLLNIGGFGARKNQEAIVRAYLASALQDSTLVLIGPEFNSYAWKNCRIDPVTNKWDKKLFWLTTQFQRRILHRLHSIHTLHGPSRPGMQVLLLERVPRDMVVSAYHEADLFLLASTNECFPVVAVEAMAAGLPFISTDCGNVRDLPGGVVVSSVEEMARAIRRLGGREAEWEKLSQAGRAKWEREFTWEKIVDAYQSLYLRLCRG